VGDIPDSSCSRWGNSLLLQPKNGHGEEAELQAPPSSSSVAIPLVWRLPLAREEYFFGIPLVCHKTAPLTVFGGGAGLRKCWAARLNSGARKDGSLALIYLSIIIMAWQEQFHACGFEPDSPCGAYACCVENDGTNCGGFVVHTEAGVDSWGFNYYNTYAGGGVSTSVVLSAGAQFMYPAGSWDGAGVWTLKTLDLSAAVWKCSTILP
jgi:hypothetical protein